MKMKYILMVLSLTIFKITSACDACEKQQPKITQGLTHGTGPQSNWDWVIISLITAITLLTFFYSLKYLIKPDEKNTDHIKQSILNN